MEMHTIRHFVSREKTPWEQKDDFICYGTNFNSPFLPSPIMAREV